jgi:hypothetical protein
MCDDSAAAVQQAVSKLFQKFFSIYFALRNPPILMNENVLLRVLSVVESTEHSTYTTGAAFGTLPELDST